MSYIGTRPAYGELHNRMMEQGQAPAPAVGMDATALYWSDRHAGKITWVHKNGKVLRFCVTNRGYKLETSTEPDDAAAYTFSLRKSGRWVMKGESDRSGTGLAIGRFDPRYDEGF